MIKQLLILVILGCFLNVSAQLKLIDPTFPGGNLNNTTINVSGTPAGGIMEFYCSVINLSSQDYSIKCKVTEIDVLADTENNICWLHCPPYSYAGDNSMYVIKSNGVEVSNNVLAGDTLIGFSAHYKPKNYDGCSLFLFEFFDASNPANILANVRGRFTHNISTSCTASLLGNNSFKFSMYPNPVKDKLTFKVDESNLSVQVLDLLGKTVIEKSILFNNKTIDISRLKNGVYFASVLKNGIVLKTEKLIVKH